MSATRPKSNLPVNNNGTAVVSYLNGRPSPIKKLDSGFQDPTTIAQLATQYDNRLKEGIIVKTKTY